MRWLQSTVLVLLLLGTLGGESGAAEPAAAGSKTPSAEVAKRAEALFQEATRLVDEKKWAEAEAKLLQAWALNPTFDIASNLGQVQTRLGKLRQAATNLAFALRNWPVFTGMADKRARAQKRLDEVRPLVAAVTVTVNVADAAISVDGERVGMSPMKEEIFLDPGAHTVEATLAGHGKAAQKIDGAKGSTLNVSLTLSPSAAPSPVTAPATSDAAQTPVTQREAKAQAVKPTPIEPQLPPHGSVGKPHPALIIASGALALGGIGAGIGLTVTANGKAAEAAEIDKTQGSNSACYKQPGIPIAADCGALKEAVDDKYTFTRAAQASFILGGAFALTAAGLYIST